MALLVAALPTSLVVELILVADVEHCLDAEDRNWSEAVWRKDEQLMRNSKECGCELVQN